MRRSTTKRERAKAFRDAGVLDPKAPMTDAELQDSLKQRRRKLRGPNKRAYQRPAPGQAC